MRIVITGAAGSVGTALLRRLAQRNAEGAGHEVVGIGRRLPPADRHPYDTATWTSLDIADPARYEDLRRVVRGADAVVHAAWLIQPARDPAELARVNLGGSRALVRAVREEGVGHLVHLSSIGAYAPHPADDRRVDERWPTTGVQSHQYSREKAALEAHLDVVEPQAPQLTVTRVRPALVFQHDSASEIARYFAGALVPARALGRVPLPVLPLPRGVRFQVIHADDLADGLVRIVEQRAGGAFNLADEPVLGGRDLGRALNARTLVPVPRGLARTAVAGTYHARIHPVKPGWFDLGMSVPVMDTNRARTELGWQPRHAAADVLEELLAGMREHAGTPSPTLRSRSAAKPGSRVGT
ncbi:NAD-dependent epimerase/dehydratase family protein [Kineococcus sp. SYSU DK018]|uniref:NAD-dependent epimerase/dehydratase family protein n=1 Tax=Kineococcus sp. SYSU DK018 TaxID=3383139 RepID=UPI003D7E59B8